MPALMSLAGSWFSFCYNRSMAMAKMKNYSSFSEWREDQSKSNLKLIDRLQALIEQTAPGLDTTVKWGQGCWVANGSPRVFIHCEEDHVQLGFYNGSSFHDPQGLLSGKGKFVRFVKVYSEEDIQPETYSGLIKQAVSRA